jgi:AcrR family transcriptional regulator
VNTNSCWFIPFQLTGSDAGHNREASRLLQGASAEVTRSPSLPAKQRAARVDGACVNRSLRYSDSASAHRSCTASPRFPLRVFVAILKLPLKKTSKSKPKRKPGKRAGLTKSAIAAGATKLIETVGPAEFSLRKLASAMGVGPTSIHAHFKGGVGAILKAISVQALAGTTRPFKPMEEPAEYLRELLLKILLALHARPTVARLVVLRLSSDPIMDPLLAERLLLTLTALGVPAKALPKKFQRAMGVILEMISTVSARSGAAEQKDLSAEVHEAIAALSASEFPNLTELREALVAETIQAGASKPSEQVAALYAGRLIATLCTE